MTVNDDKSDSTLGDGAKKLELMPSFFVRDKVALVVAKSEAAKGFLDDAAKKITARLEQRTRLYIYYIHIDSSKKPAGSFKSLAQIPSNQA